MSGCGCACPVQVTTAAQVTVPDTETLALAENDNRRNATIENHGETDVYLYFETGQDASAPILLPQFGSWSALQGGIIYTGPVYAITLTSSTVVGVLEET